MAAQGTGTPKRTGRRRRRGWRSVLVALALGLALSAACLAFRDLPLVSAIEGQTLNWRFRLRGPIGPPAGVAVVAIDDRTIGAIGRSPLPRRVLADAVARLDAAGAAVIGVDLLLLEPEQADGGMDLEPGGGPGIDLGPGDRALRAALAAAGNAVLAVAFTAGPTGPTDPERREALRRAAFGVVQRPAYAGDAAVLRASGALLPIAPLREVAGLGHVNVPIDPDGALHHLPLAVGFAEAYVPSLPVEMARRALGLDRDKVALLLGRGLLLGARLVPTDARMRLALDYYGPAGTVPTYSLIDLLEDRVPAGAFAGRAVLLGATALGTGDTFVSPFSPVLPGVEVLATGLANLLGGEALRHATGATALDLAAILLLGFATFALARLPRPVVAALATGVLLVAWIALVQLAFEERRLWLDVTFPTLSILVNAGFAAVSRLGIERGLRREAERRRRNLSRYHSPVIADLLAEGGAPGPEGREQPAAILFVDMAGFTTRSETMRPADTARFLRAFHHRVERAVLAHGGVLEQFTGDGAMVVFGMPAPGPRDAVAALACALDLEAGIREWSRTLESEGDAPLAIGIGIHYGPVVVARLGGQEQIQLSVAGDTVNVASRIEALTRTHGTTIAVSAALVAAVRTAGREDLLTGFAELPAQPIRGREGRIAVWIRRADPPG